MRDCKIFIYLKVIFRPYLSEDDFEIKSNYKAMAASGTNTEILQFDWFISGRMFPRIVHSGEEFEKALLKPNKN